MRLHTTQLFNVSVKFAPSGDMSLCVPLDVRSLNYNIVKTTLSLLSYMCPC